MLAGLLICTLGSICFQRWWTGMLLVIATIWCSIGVLSVYLQVEQASPGDTKIRIMSHNVLSGNRSYDAVKKQVSEVDPDLFVIVEYDEKWHKAMQSIIEDGTYPYFVRAPRWHGFGVAIFSKLPLTDTQTYQLTAEITDVPMVTAEFMVGDQKVRLAGVHAFSPTNADRLHLRNEQLTEMAKILKQSDTPTIVMGDYNCVPWSPFLDDFLKQTGYRDSRVGFGYQGSWSARYRWTAMIPIDHAFVSRKVHVHDRYIGESAGSDHFPVIVEISISRE